MWLSKHNKATFHKKDCAQCPIRKTYDCVICSS